MIRRVLRRLVGERRGAPAPARAWTLADYPVDPRARSLDDAWDPAFLAALDADPASAAIEVHPGIYAIRPLRPAWCAALAAEVARLHRWARERGVTIDPPNSMNRYGVATLTLGLDLGPVRERLAPLTRRLFPAHATALDADHAFVVRYAPREDRELSFHADDAEVTLNLCLADGFEGGELYFEGPRCFAHLDTPARDGEPFVWAHQPGVGLLHAGANRHGARPILGGERHNLIVWMRDGAARAAREPGEPGPCPSWCGARAT